MVKCSVNHKKPKKPKQVSDDSSFLSLDEWLIQVQFSQQMYLTGLTFKIEKVYVYKYLDSSASAM